MIDHGRTFAQKSKPSYKIADLTDGTVLLQLGRLAEVRDAQEDISNCLQINR
jgi:hypothetical protein